MRRNGLQRQFTFLRRTRTQLYASLNFEKVMSSNRGEIAIRFFRAGTELGKKTVAVYSNEDKHSLHRYKADQAYVVGSGKTPVGAYLDYKDMIRIALMHGVDAIHPGYGFLSENVAFSQACQDAGIAFIGPPPEVLRMFGDKTSARNLAIAQGVPVIPGTTEACHDVEDARKFIKDFGYPVMLKAVNGGGGRGMRVVRSENELDSAFASASGEALTAFGDGSMFVEKLIERPMHIEVQLLGDGSNHVHLFERDCSVQRRHQKIVEIAPAVGITDEMRQKILADALKLGKAANYKNAGTVEFLVDEEGKNHYFIEVNPRIQVEHTVTEEITGIDIVASQIRIAEGKTLKELGLEQSKISQRGFAIQARVTTEDPLSNFSPDYGRLDVFRAAEGMGIRLDAASGFGGAIITPHYDSLLCKVTAHALTFDLAAAKLRRALTEFRVRGVHTNVPFIVNVLNHPDFIAGRARTDFIASHPELLKFPPLRDRGNKMLKYLGEVAVNGHPMPGANPAKLIPKTEAPIPATPPTPPPYGWKQVLEKHGPEGFAKAVRQHPRTLFADTTWRDAHQSLFATRMRTIDMATIAPATAHAMAGMYALECWGGATFDVSLRFLRECPWERLEMLRELVPNIPFQMLLRGANAVGYTSYPDNVVHAVCKQSVKSGMDVFRVFDSLNYVPNLLLGMEAVHAAGGVVQGEICYTGDVLDPTSKYNLDYYLKLADEIINKGESHVLGIKDMAGLLKPEGAKKLVTALRREFPTTPIHVHTHDTAGIGVASMIAAAKAGADVVHGALDSMSGTTSQPSLGALVASLSQVEAGKKDDTMIFPVKDVLLEPLLGLNDYWASVRTQYAPFEQTVPSSSSDVFIHQMPGGQYTNLLFQSQEMGLVGQWKAVKDAYAEANKALGDIVKVTPSSKVVGDLAQFMVTNKITTAEELVEASAKLTFPSSVNEFLAGDLGEPLGGFPEPLRSRVLKRANLKPIVGRPGERMPSLNLDEMKKTLQSEYVSLGREGLPITDGDVLSAALYPQVFKEYQQFRETYGKVSHLPTRSFVQPMKPGESFSVDVDEGKRIYIKMMQVSPESDEQGQRSVFFELNGVPREVRITDKSLKGSAIAQNVRADKSNAGHVAASMPGTLITILVKKGDKVKEGDVVAKLSAMKMETSVAASRSGTVESIHPAIGSLVKAGDLVMVINE